MLRVSRSIHAFPGFYHKWTSSTLLRSARNDESPYVMLRVSRSIHVFFIFWIATPGLARLAMTHTICIIFTRGHGEEGWHLVVRVIASVAW